MLIVIGGKKLKIKNCKGFSSFLGLSFDEMKNHDGAIIYANNIWMPFVKHDLDLFFLDKTFRVIDIQKAVPITLNPKTWKIHKNKNARYCLEIKAGLVSAIKGMEIIWKW